MSQAVLAFRPKAPASKAGKNAELTLPHKGADIIDLHDFFVRPAGKSLPEAKARILRELPPKPDYRRMTDIEKIAAMYDHNRMRLYVYETVLFG